MPRIHKSAPLGGRRKGACLGRHMTTSWKYLIQLRHIYIVKQSLTAINKVQRPEKHAATQASRDLAHIPASQHGPAWMVHLPQRSLSKYHCSRIHPRKHPITRAEHSLWGLAGVDTAMSMTATITHPGHALLVRLHHPSRDPPPSPNVIMFQEHWAHKPGHVLRCPVCQNNSAVCNTPGQRFLPRYSTTPRPSAYLMSTTFDLPTVAWAFYPKMSQI